MSNVVRTREADRLVPSLVALFKRPAFEDPGRCEFCAGEGRVLRADGERHWCHPCRGTGWPKGIYPFRA